MNDKQAELGDLAIDLGRMQKEHRDALSRESEIAGHLDRAAEAARRRYKAVTEGNIIPE